MLSPKVNLDIKAEGEGGGKSPLMVSSQKQPFERLSNSLWWMMIPCWLSIISVSSSAQAVSLSNLTPVAKISKQQMARGSLRSPKLYQDQESVYKPQPDLPPSLPRSLAFAGKINAQTKCSKIIKPSGAQKRGG